MMKINKWWSSSFGDSGKHKKKQKEKKLMVTRTRSTKHRNGYLQKSGKE
jgi:hypothetical protein